MTNFKNYSTTLILGCVLALMTLPRHAGIILIMFVPVFAIWVPYSFVLMWRFPAVRQLQLNKLLFWSVLIGSIVAAHWFYASSARKNADAIVNQIDRFNDTHHRYPTNLGEIGIDAGQLKSQLGMAGYLFDSNHTPKLYYAVTYVPFDTYQYSFQNQTWSRRGS